MTLTEKDVQKFQAVFESEFGTCISVEQATERGLKLVNLLSVVYRPMTIDDAKRINEHRIKNKQKLIELLNK